MSSAQALTRRCKARLDAPTQATQSDRSRTAPCLAFLGLLAPCLWSAQRAKRQGAAWSEVFLGNLLPFAMLATSPGSSVKFQH